MKTSAKNCSGSVLVGAMIFVVLIASSLVSYLLLVQNSDQAVARAQQWNSALPIAEAGIEEAMAKLNSVAITTNTNSISFTLPQQSLNGGYYNVANNAVGMTNTITSIGTVHAPITDSLIFRTVRVTAQRLALFSKGVISMTSITLNGSGSYPIAVDSYDSRLGPYNSSTAGTNGDVAALNGMVDTGNHWIYGDLFLGPNSALSSNPNGGVTGTTYTDWNMVLYPSTLPTFDANGYSIVWTPAPGDSSSHSFTNSGYYLINDAGDLHVSAGITVTLHVTTSNYNLKQAVIDIQGGTTNSGTIVIYQDSGSFTLGGSSSGGAINNQPKNFVYFGLPDVISITMSGGSDFQGVIYAPQADMTLSGGGSAVNLMGSFIVNSLTVNGHYLIHYDTSLAGYYWGYNVVGSWQEL